MALDTECFMLSVARKLNTVMLNDFMQSVNILNVVAPSARVSYAKRQELCSLLIRSEQVNRVF
jgi:hypothetical protein